jgi:hypothetical protein
MDARDGTPRILGLTSDEIVELFQKEARLCVAWLLERGEPVYSSGKSPVLLATGSDFLHVRGGTHARAATPCEDAGA